VNACGAGIAIDPLAFIKRDQQEGGHKWQRYWGSEVGQWL
jgi:hypothetical protein